VFEVLQERDAREALRQAVQILNQNLCDLREDVALAAEALLTYGGRMDPKEARAWAEQNLREP